jgi:hypothetical protein
MNGSPSLSLSVVDDQQGIAEGGGDRESWVQCAV